MSPIEGISEHPPISIVLGPLYFVLTYVFARPYLNEASVGATELLELWVLLTCSKWPSPFAASRCRNLQLVHDALVEVTAPGPPASSGNSARGRQHTWELLAPWHAGQVASRVYE